MLLLDWPPPHHLWIGPNRGNSRPSQRWSMPAQTCLLRSWN